MAAARKVPVKRKLSRSALTKTREEKLVEIIAGLNREIAGLEDQKKAHTAELCDLMQASKDKTIKVTTSDGLIAQGTLVAPQPTLVLDEGKLKKNLGAKLWVAITTRVLDRKKLDAFLASGEIDAAVIAQCSNESPRTPYIKITVK